MYRTINRSLAALGAVMAISLGGSPAGAATPEVTAMAHEVAATLFEATDLKTAIATSMEKSAGSLDGFDIRPGWKAMLIQAMIDETIQDMPALQDLVGDRFAEYFTADELKAGTAILKDPAIRTILAAGAAGRDIPAGVAPSRATERLARTPAGAGFMKKFGSLETVMNVLEADFAAEIIPGAFRRFADKAEAAEAARAAAP